MGENSGLKFFSTGSQWENAFFRSLKFLENSDGIIVLGPGIGLSGEVWIQEQLLKKQPVFFGNRILPWKEFVKNRARVASLSQGKAFKAFHQASYRAFARTLFSTLDSTGAYAHISGLWREERFFDGFLRCLEEARGAGFTDSETIERAFHRLKKADDPIYREVYEDFRFSLIMMEKGISAKEILFDFPRMLQEAKEWPDLEKEIFCLGFDSFSLLEVDLLQSIALKTNVFLPLSLEEERVDLLRKVQVDPEDLTEATFLALCNNFSGSITWEKNQLPTNPTSRAVLLEAHSPQSEIATVAKWAEENLLRNNSVRIIGKKGFVKDFSRYFSFSKISSSEPLSSHALAKTFFHCLRLKSEDFPVASVVELASFLHSILGKFHSISKMAAEFGIRKGLSGWRRLAEESKDQEIKEFLAILDSIATLFPERATASEYQLTLSKFVEILQLGKLADQSFPLGEDSGVHGVVAAILRFSQMLSASVEEVFLYEDWLRELELLIESSPLGEEESYEGLEFYQYGEWLPPSEKPVKTLALGFTQDILPNRSFQFYLEEGVRRRLSEFLFSSQLSEEAAFLKYAKKLLGQSCIFSRPKMDSVGRETSPNSVVPLLDFSVVDWPQVSLENAISQERLVKDIYIRLNGEKKLSASFLEQYKECPFKAYALKILKLEDSAKTPSLDVTALDLGSLSHKVLELFYGKIDGKAGGFEKLEENVSLAIAEAVKEVSLRFFKGGEFLWNAQLLRMKETLLEFLRSDLAFYASFPEFQKADFEKKLSGKIGEVLWTGKADRVDYDPNQKRFLVLDYKSGSTLPPTKEIEERKRFQIPLYIDAIQKEFGMEAIGGLYVSLKTGKRNQGLVKKRFNRTKKTEEAKEQSYFELHARSGCLKNEEDFSEIIDASFKEMQSLSKEIQKGVFSVTPLDEAKCKKCEVRPACRIRSLESPQKEFSKIGPVSFSQFAEQSLNLRKEEKKEKKFNEEQLTALNKSDRLVFVEASAGTGKTTVIVEKIQRFLENKIQNGFSTVKATERFSAISFTEKSTEELRIRLTKSLSGVEGIGTLLATHAKNQISTIHGFCKKVISEFPLESKVPPLAELMDEREKEILLEEVLERFFTEPNTDRKALLESLFAYFDRMGVERILRTFLEKRLLWKKEMDSLEIRLRDHQAYSSAKLEDQILFQFLQLFHDFYDCYQRSKKSEQKIDFNDLEAGALEALTNETVSQFYKKKLDLILVDEFQDTNSVQREILEKVAREGWSNFFVVGDAKQSIYRFRAADVGVFQALRQEASEKGALVLLFRNYRSRSELVESSNQISEAIFPKDLGEAKPFEALYSQSEAGRETGGESEVLQFEMPEKTSAAERRKLEAIAVARSIKQHIELGVEPSEIAILLRKISGNESFLKTLAEEKIPFRVGSSKGFYSQPVILDALALLRALFYPFHALAVFSLLRSPFIGCDDQWIYERTADRKLDSLFDLVEEKSAHLANLKKKLPYLNLSEILEQGFRIYPYDQKDFFQIEKLKSILQQLEEKGFPKLEIVERVSNWAGWASESESDDDATMPEPSGKGAVAVMTVHSSKGLEFDLTILPDLVSNLSSDTLPLRGIPRHGIELQIEDRENPDFDDLKELDKQMEVAEWKRLFYVAFTRAKEKNIFVLPNTEGKLGERWGDYLRKAKIESKGSKVWKSKERTVAQFLSLPKSGLLELFPRITTSISEIAANRFCSEFHRRKFVAGWDDLVVALLPKPIEHVKKPKKYLVTPSKASRLLRKLKLENKERGIALHRVLERMGLPQEEFALWLREAYLSQGAAESDSSLDELIEEDLSLLEKFLHSPTGKMLFDTRFEAFPEISFRWKQKNISLFGTIDRLVKKSDSEWLVVDYKSSLLEDSLERYRFQVESYMCAVSALAARSGKQKIQITGYLVDLSSSNALEIGFDESSAMKKLEEEMEKVAQNLILQENVFDLHARGIRADEHCFSCAYSLHCDLGTKFVLAFQ
jgi:ATP-dependent exoDNAse (exonuclease V) beta subunit